ncbi:MAG: fumarylacetoacetate hydrolase family protein [Chloroflexi bacterium]|nr:fumarylacetoacetate hydrolase family protein [Chloroflexota bacterium]
MKIVRFERSGVEAYGVLEGDTIRAVRGSVCEDFALGEQMCRLGEARLLAPVQPRIIVCVAANYYCLQQELGREIPREPEVFLKPASAVIGHLDHVVYPEVSNSVSCGGELAVVIRREARRVPEDGALEFVLGYTCGLDVTAQDLLKERFQTRAKSFYTFCSLGPWVETSVAGDDLLLRSRVNGNLVLDHRTGGMIFGVGQAVSYISQFMALQPLDVVLMGTPKPETEVDEGDAIEVEIEGIGTLRNAVTRTRQ